MRKGEVSSCDDVTGDSGSLTLLGTDDGSILNGGGESMIAPTFATVNVSDDGAEVEKLICAVDKIGT